MKQHLLNLTFSCLLLMLTFLGCKRETATAPDEFLVLKAFYNENKPSANSLFKNVAPNWNNVNKLEHADFWVYEVAVSNPDRVGLTSKELTAQDIGHYDNTHSLKLLLFVNPQSKEIVKGCYMAVEANNKADLGKVHYKQTNGLNGQVIYYHLNGTFSNGVAYIAGKPAYKIQALPAQEVLALKKQREIRGKNGDITVQGCSTYLVETGYTGCVYDYCHWYSTGFYYFTTCDGPQEKQIALDEYGGGGGGGPTPLSPDCAGVPGGAAYNSECGCIGGSTGIESCADIKHKLDSFPCAKNLVAQMNNLNSDISNLIKNAFNKNDRINLTIEPNYSLQGTSTDGKLGQNSKFTYNNQLYFSISVGINPDILKNATKEYILVTIYHEAIHAYLALKKAELGEAEFNNQFTGIYVNGGRLIGAQDPQHWSMAYTNFVNGLQNVILAYNPNFNADRAYALALGGIISLTPAQNIINQQEKNTTISGYTGTKCP